ncbi:MAG: nucleoid-associated protein, YbaB/EbfC family [Crocinitomicaceae bacterium]|nr:nucleoid-associated protein, YbaB/EbfC family [Crocinitomicaceae bacterium]|tara:strand:- start:9585 stop:9911 length:327 start_codon:yes stop_codon:yes gene_type:complete
MFDMMGKISEAKKKVEETKERLNSVYVTGESGNGKIKIVATANREVKEVNIDETLMQGDKEELEDLMILAINKAIENATNVQEAELAAAAKDVMPNIPGLGSLGKMFG